MSRSIIDVIVAVQEDQPVPEEELRLTLLSLSYMLDHADRDIARAAEAAAKHSGSVVFCVQHADKERKIRFTARQNPPSRYLGPRWTPGTPENRKARELAEKIFKAATGHDFFDEPTTEGPGAAETEG